MARSLVWADLSAEQLDNLRNPRKGINARDLLSKYMGLTHHRTESTEAVLLDMYTYTLQFGQEHKMPSDKLSALVSIMKAVHTRSTADRLPVDRSFALFKSLLMQHSIQRPPHSVGLFSLPEFKQILGWGLDTYYRHYKLYQYAFTDRVLLSVTQEHPSDNVELAPFVGLPPLQEAITQEEHNELLAHDRQQDNAFTTNIKSASAVLQTMTAVFDQHSDAVKAEEEAAAAAEEQARLARLREEYEAAVPDEIRDRVQEAVDRELVLLKQSMESQFDSQHQALLAKISALESKLTVS